MILTMPLLILLWSLAVLSPVIAFVANRYYRAPLVWFAIGYLAVGLFGLGIPFRIAIPATSAFGMLFLTVIWPFWIGQSLGYTILDHLPMWFNSLLFSF